MDEKEKEWLKKAADVEEEAGGFPTETGVIVGKLKTIETETLKVVQAGVPEDPEHALLHYLKVADRHTPCTDRGGIVSIAIHEAEKVAHKLIEHIWRIETDLEGYHFRDRDLSVELATWKKRAEVAEGTVAEINQIIEDALANEEKPPVDEKPPFEIGTRVYCTFSEARGDMGTVIDHCRDIDGEKVNVRLDNGMETGFCPVSSFAEPATK